ncbi:MAG: hypothetical protein WC735_04810, partial [Candidatus Paceibacterota bacterium]
MYLLAIGSATKDQITLVVTKDSTGNRSLQLEIINTSGVPAQWSTPFPDFKIGMSFDVELVWSSERNLIAVFIGNNEDPIMIQKDPKIQFVNLGNTVHYGEDINGDGQTEMNCSPKTQ